MHDGSVSLRPAHYNTRYKFDLSPRQREVLDLIARGQTNAEIADSLGVSLDGAKYHVREILAKLDVESREEAASYWHAYNRPTAKLARALSGVFGLGTLKVVAGSAALVAAGGAVAAIVVGINAARESGSGGDAVATLPADDTPPATATADATATAPAAETPEQFARRIAGLVRAGQVDDLLALSEPVSFTCPGPTPQGAGGPFPLCNGATAGEERQGYVVAPDLSEVSTIAADAFAAEADAALTGDLELASIGTPGTGDSIVIGFAASNGGAVYLAFDAAPGETPQLRGLGTTQSQAAPIRNGGQAIIFTGPTTFQPLN